MSISINYIAVSFLSPDFDGTIDIAELRFYSTDREWAAADLKQTFSQDLKKGTITLFKELSFESLKLVVYPKSSTIARAAMDDPLTFGIRMPSIRIIRIKSLLDNAVTFSMQMQLVLSRLSVELSKFQVQIATHMVASIHRYMAISEALIPRKEKLGAALAEDESMLSGSFHLKLGQFEVSLREPRTRGKAVTVGHRYLTRLLIDRIILHHFMEQAVQLATLPDDGLRRQFIEDRDIWVKQLYGSFLDHPLLRCNTTNCSMADVSIRSQTGVAGPTNEIKDIVLLCCNYEKYHLPAETPAVNLEYTSYFYKNPPPAGRAKVARGAMRSEPTVPPQSFPIPPPCLYGRVYPMQIFFKLDAVMQLVRFAESSRLGSHVLDAEASSATYEKLVRQISQAPDLQQLATFGDEVKKFRDLPNATRDAVDALRAAYNRRLEELVGCFLCNFLVVSLFLFFSPSIPLTGSFT